MVSFRGKSNSVRSLGLVRKASRISLRRRKVVTGFKRKVSGGAVVMTTCAGRGTSALPAICLGRSVDVHTHGGGDHHSQSTGAG